MFRLQLCFLLLVSTLHGEARRTGTARDFVYLETGLGRGYPNRFKLAANLLYDAKNELAFSYSYYERRGKNIPEEYDERDFFSNSIAYPQESFSSVGIAYGRVLYPKRGRDVVRYILRAGVEYGHRSSPFNYMRGPSGWFGSNWSHETHESDAFAITFNPVFQYTPARAFGLGFGPYAIFSDHFSGAGFSAYLLVGKVSNRIPERRIKDRRRMKASKKAAATEENSSTSEP